MKLERVASPSAKKLLRWLPRFRRLRVVVWGDFMADEYWFCRSGRLSREAPVPVLEFEGRELKPGGAANAALNLAAMGATVEAVGWTGADEARERLIEALRRHGVRTAGLAARRGESTVVKIRVVAGTEHTARQQVVRVDRGRPFARNARAGAQLDTLLTRVTNNAHAIVLSDYGYDTVTPALANPLIPQWRERGIVVGLDSRFRLAEYRGVSFATPNESEASGAVNVKVDGDRDLARVAARLRETLAPDSLMITRGRDGLTVWNHGGGQALDAWGGAEAVDVTGAGDAVVAAATLALAAGAPPLEAAALANVAGSVAVSRRGAVAVTPEDLRRALRAPAGAAT
jgi:rfaE bifunctional protein kinase chain/domain